MTGMKNKQEYEEELRMGKGGFTLPGESGYEACTLKMAEINNAYEHIIKSRQAG